MKISRSLIRILTLLSVFTFCSLTFAGVTSGEGTPGGGGNATLANTYVFAGQTQAGNGGLVITLFGDGNASVVSSHPPGIIQGVSGSDMLSDQQGRWEIDATNNVKVTVVGIVSDRTTGQFRDLAQVQYAMAFDSSTGTVNITGIGGSVVGSGGGGTGGGAAPQLQPFDFQLQPLDIQLQPLNSSNTAIGE